MLALATGCKEDDPLRRVEPATAVSGSVIGPDHARLRPEFVAMDFPTTERGFLATRDGRLLASHDGGRSWQPVGPRHRFVELEFVTPRNGYALTLDGALLATNDGARSWRFVRAFPAEEANGPFRPAVRFVDARRGWVIPSDQRIYRTLDRGRSWTRLAFRCSFVLGGASPAGRTTGYALCGGQPATIEQRKDLYATRDGGSSWRLVTRAPFTGHASGLVFRSPRDGLMLASRLGIYRTRDGGRHWRTTLFTDDAFFVRTVAWPAPRQLYALLWQAGVLASDDGGKHWEQRYPAAQGPPEGPVSFSSQTDGIGAGKGGFFRNPGAILATANGGKTWTVRTVIRGVAVDQLVRVSQRVVWAVGTEWNRNGRARLAILRTGDGGRTWRKLTSPHGVTAASLSVPAVDVAFLAPALGSRLFRTTDGGNTWTVVRSNQDVGGARFVTANLGVALRQDGGLAHTTDGGKTWKPVRIVPSLRVVGFAHLDDRHWWLAGLTCRRRSPAVKGKPSACIGGKQLLRTADGGRSWEAIRLRAWPGSADFDFVTPAVGYAGNGTYRTTDGGRTWSPVDS